MRSTPNSPGQVRQLDGSHGTAFTILRTRDHYSVAYHRGKVGKSSCAPDGIECLLDSLAEGLPVCAKRHGLCLPGPGQGAGGPQAASASLSAALGSFESLER